MDFSFTTSSQKIYGFGACALCAADEGAVEGNEIGAVGAGGQMEGIGEIEALGVEV
jgi:hypothetical protein